MGLIDKYKGGESFGRIGEGAFPARIVQVFYMGIQEGFEGKDTNKIWLTFELPTEMIETQKGTQPRWLSSEFTKSTNEKSKLYKVVKAVDDGKLEDFQDLLGKELLVEVGSTSGGKDKFINATRLPRGMEVLDLHSPLKFFDDENPDWEVLAEMPQFLRENIMKSKTWKHGDKMPIKKDGFPAQGGMPSDSPFDDEPPF